MPSIRSWKRPEHVPLPSVWRRCTGRRAMANGKLPKFIIQDLPEDRMEDLLDFMCTSFIKDETFCASSGLARDPISIEEMRAQWLDKFKQRVTLVAFVEDEPGKPRIAGCNVMWVVSKDDQENDKITGEAVGKFMGIVKYMGEVGDLFQRFDVDEYLAGIGLSISPEFRGQGLGLEIMRARFDLGRALNLRATATVFSGIQSQTVAAQSGMELLLDVPFEDYKVDGEVVFPVAFPKSIKLMGARIE